MNIPENIDDLRAFLKDPQNDEGRYHDCKVALPSADNVRKVFCAFANSDGGLIFIGVRDQTNEIVGVNRQPELRTNLETILSAGVNPKIHHWDVAKTIPVGSNRFIYVVSVHPSPSHLRPHVTQERVYRRGNGRCVPINCGRELRDFLHAESFSAHHINVLEHQMAELEEVIYTARQIDFLYMARLRHYLFNNRSHPGFDELLRLFSSIMQKYDRLQAPPSVADFTSLSELDNHNIVELQSQICSELSRFVSKFRDIHFGGGARI